MDAHRNSEKYSRELQDKPILTYAPQSNCLFFVESCSEEELNLQNKRMADTSRKVTKSSEELCQTEPGGLTPSFSTHDLVGFDEFHSAMAVDERFADEECPQGMFSVFGNSGSSDAVRHHHSHDEWSQNREVSDLKNTISTDPNAYSSQWSPKKKRQMKRNEWQGDHIHTQEDINVKSRTTSLSVSVSSLLSEEEEYSLSHALNQAQSYQSHSDAHEHTREIMSVAHEIETMCSDSSEPFPWLPGADNEDMIVMGNERLSPTNNQSDSSKSKVKEYRIDEVRFQSSVSAHEHRRRTIAEGSKKKAFPIESIIPDVVVVSDCESQGEDEAFVDHIATQTFRNGSHAIGHHIHKRFSRTRSEPLILKSAAGRVIILTDIHPQPSHGRYRLNEKGGRSCLSSSHSANSVAEDNRYYNDAILASRSRSRSSVASVSESTVSSTGNIPIEYKNTPIHSIVTLLDEDIEYHSRGEWHHCNH